MTRIADMTARDDLARFPCGFEQEELSGDPKPCGGDCAAVEFDRPCPFLLVYKKALAYKRCARLLAMRERWLTRPGLFSPPARIVLGWQARLRRLSRTALREAGL